MVTLLLLRTGARNMVHDRLDDHWSKDDLSAQVDGTQTRFQAVNRNIVGTVDLAPSNPVCLVNGVVTATATLDKGTGIFTLAVAPVAGATLELDYYFVLCIDAVYDEFALDSANFVGQTTISGVPDNLVDACHHYIAGKIAQKMSSLTSWYYQAQAGNKSFNKDAIAKKFSDMAKEMTDEAVARRDDVYKRWGKRNAPSQATVGINGINTVYTPRR